MATQPTSPTGAVAQRVEQLTAKAVKSNKCCGQIVTLQVSNFQEASRKFDEAARPIDPNSPEAQAKVAAGMRKMEEDLAKISEQHSLKNKLRGYANTAVEAFKETFTNSGGTARGIGGSILNLGPDIINMAGEASRLGAGAMYVVAGGLADAAGRAAGYGTGGGDEAFASAHQYFNDPGLVPWRLDPLYKPQEGIEQFWYTMSPINWWPAAGGRTVGGRVAINTAEGVLNVTPSTLREIDAILLSKTPALAVKRLDSAIEAAKKAGASPADIAALEQARVGVGTGKIKLPGSASADGVAVNELTPAQILRRRAQLTAPKITKDITKIAEGTGGKQEGLGFAKKEVDSLERKLLDTPPDKIKDSLRYTVTYEPDKLATNANKAMSELETMGYEKLQVKNTFEPGAQYMGVNTFFKDPATGQIFELQFHTPASFEVKQYLTHDLFEQARVLPSGSAERLAIEAQITRISDTNIVIPRDVRNVRKYP
jgi:hypothetical protein